MSKKNVAVFFGGKSTEHDVSIVTAISSVIKPLEASEQYIAVPVYITKQGEWYTDERLKDISAYSSGAIDALIEKLSPVQVKITGTGMVLCTTKKIFNTTNEIPIDVAFPAMHGTYGEDGSLMGLLRMTGVPFVGCDMEASVIAMNKLLAHTVVEAGGASTHPYFGFTKHQYQSKNAEILTQLHKKLTYPMFVKPVHLGSSIGITHVSSNQELHDAIAAAFYYDDIVIVENAVPNLIEVTVPIIGGETPVVGLVERPLFGADETFDFDKKYMSQGKGKIKNGGSKSAGAQGYSELPAKLPKDLYKKCESIALNAYNAIGCYGIARVDLLIDSKTNQVFFNEINPLPGSLYVHNWRAKGMSSLALVERLIASAVERAEDKKKMTTVFSSNFLKQF